MLPSSSNNHHNGGSPAPSPSNMAGSVGTGGAASPAVGMEEDERDSLERLSFLARRLSMPTVPRPPVPQHMAGGAGTTHSTSPASAHSPAMTPVWNEFERVC